MAAAVGWGALAASSLVLGALLAFARRWSAQPIGLILAFGAGALISAVSFNLAEEGIHVGSTRAVGIGLAVDGGIGVALLVAIFVSNLPEGIGSAIDMNAAGTRRDRIVRLFLAVGVVCTVATVLGYAIADSITGDLQAAVNGFAAGALLVMLIDSMIPEASKKAGGPAGLATVVGFAVATALSNV